MTLEARCIIAKQYETVLEMPSTSAFGARLSPSHMFRKGSIPVHLHPISFKRRFLYKIPARFHLITMSSDQFHMSQCRLRRVRW